MFDVVFVKHRNHYLKNVFDYLLLNVSVAGFAMSLGTELERCKVRKFLDCSNKTCPYSVNSSARLVFYHLVEFIL